MNAGVIVVVLLNSSAIINSGFVLPFIRTTTTILIIAAVIAMKFHELGGGRLFHVPRNRLDDDSARKTLGSAAVRC